MRALTALLLMIVGTPAVAQTIPAPAPRIAAGPALTARINELVAVVADTGDFDAYFSPAFHAALPRSKWDAVVAQVTAQMGKPLAVEGLTATSRWAGTLRLRFERGIVNVQLAVDPAPPHQVTGLLFTGAELAGDTFDKLAADFGKLPGASGIAVQWLDDRAGPRTALAYNATTAAPLGSAFKLWVIGELAREIAAGERQWADVMPVGPPSLPSGITQGWPPGSPATVQTLATLMISISDNTATDTLVTAEGVALDKFVAGAGAPGLAPILTTRQMFAIKSPANADLAARWAATRTPSTRRTLLDANAKRLASTTLDPTIFVGNPLAIDTLEWFASPAQAVAMVDNLRRHGGRTVLDILAINPGIDAATRARFAYVGFKGGSEPGVITLNYLVRRKDGRWMAVAGNWHRADASVDNAAFVQLMTRALVLASNAPAPQ